MTDEKYELKLLSVKLSGRKLAKTDRKVRIYLNDNFRLACRSGSDYQEDMANNPQEFSHECNETYRQDGTTIDYRTIRVNDSVSREGILELKIRAESMTDLSNHSKRLLEIDKSLFIPK